MSDLNPRDRRAIRDSLREFSDEIEAAIDDAMGHITDETGAKSPLTYYQQIGFPGHNYEITFEANDAEIYVLLDLLDRVTDEPMAAGSFVPTARLLSKLLRSVPTDAAVDWLTYDGTVSPPSSTMSAAVDADADETADDTPATQKDYTAESAATEEDVGTPADTRPTDAADDADETADTDETADDAPATQKDDSGQSEATENNADPVIVEFTKLSEANEWRDSNEEALHDTDTRRTKSVALVPTVADSIKQDAEEAAR